MSLDCDYHPVPTVERQAQVTGNGVTGDDETAISTNPEVALKPLGKNKFGPGVAVSGGSR